MVQSSLAGWLTKPSAQPNGHTPNEQSHKGQIQNDTTPLPTAHRPQPPPKSSSAPPRASFTSNNAPPTSQTMENWNDIPDAFLQAPSRPRSKKSPRSSRTPTPSTLSRVTTPITTLATQQSQTPLQVSALRPLPPNVELVPLTEGLMPAFKRLVALTLPIAYPESFFKETMTEPHHSVTLVALWHTKITSTDSAITQPIEPRLVGAIRCRIVAPTPSLYISTLGILSPFRSHGIAVHLLSAVLKRAVDEHRVKSVTAHVWEANDEGLEWYAKRGFERVEKQEGYYRKLTPGGAWCMKRGVGVGDLLEAMGMREDEGENVVLR